MLRIVTDGAADMPADWPQKYDIHVIPLRIRFGEENYVQGVDIDNPGFYRLVKEKRQIPNTSLPAPDQVIEFYRSIAQKGDEILSIHITAKLSGTFSIIEMAAREVCGEFRVFPFDSGAGSAIQGFMCREARILSMQGLSTNDILKKLEWMRDRITIIFTLDSLDYARMNGRINALQSAISSMLHVKPIIVLRDGLLGMAEKARTRQRAIERVIEYVRERIGDQRVTLAVVHANAPDLANSLAGQIKNIFNLQELVITDLSIPVAANLGPGTIGIAALRWEDSANDTR
jgi:DegV family protein with EDD domain